MLPATSYGVAGSKENVALHLRLPKELYDRLITRLEQLRKKDPMVTLSEAARIVLEAGLRR